MLSNSIKLRVARAGIELFHYLSSGQRVRHAHNILLLFCVLPIVIIIQHQKSINIDLYICALQSKLKMSNPEKHSYLRTVSSLKRLMAF